MDDRIKWYRTPIDKKTMAELTQRSDFKGFVHMFAFVLMALATGAASMYLFFHAPLWAFLLMAYVHCTLFQFFGRVAASHELCHYTVFRSRWLNRLFYVAFTFLSWENWVFFRAVHMSHHQYTSHNDRDGELLLPFFVRPGRWFAIFTFDFMKFTGLLESNINFALGIFENGSQARLFPKSDAKGRAAVTRCARILLLGHAALAAAFIYFGLWPMLLLVTFAPFIGQWLNMLVALPQHLGLQPASDDFRLNSRTNKLNPVLGFLYCNMQHHIEHHMYASVPFYNLPKLRKAIEHDLPPSTGGLVSTWKVIREAWKKQEDDPNYFIPIDLPKPAA